ncbi:GIY-YIG nuclease family protein [Limimaricola variabilis]
MGQGRSLELYFVDGRPDGLLTAEVFNWTGHLLKAPRIQLREALARPEARYTGVYLLLGEDENGRMAYVGEGESIADRIRSHDAKKEWWSEVVMITTSSNNLHKAHVKYLESRLVEIALEAARVRLENGNTPPRSSLSEAGQANMEEFVETLRMVLPALGIDLFQIQKRSARKSDEATGSSAYPIRFSLSAPQVGITAYAQVEEAEFIVTQGSQARAQWVGQGGHVASYAKLYAHLHDQGILKLEGDKAIFTEHYAFSSPSAAAAVVLGRPSNGRTKWKRPESGQSYADWEAEQIGADA